MLYIALHLLPFCDGFGFLPAWLVVFLWRLSMLHMMMWKMFVCRYDSI